MRFLMPRILYRKGKSSGNFSPRSSDMLVLGECVPGGTTTALCVMRALGYDASVSSSFVNNPVAIKEEICRLVMERIKTDRIRSPLDIIRYTGDPMMAGRCRYCKDLFRRTHPRRWHSDACCKCPPEKGKTIPPVCGHDLVCEGRSFG